MIHIGEGQRFYKPDGVVEPSDAEPVLSPPPVEEWLENLFSDKQHGTIPASLLLARVLELHLGEGLRLVKKFTNEITQRKSTKNFFMSVAYDSNVISRYKPLFKSLLNRCERMVQENKDEPSLTMAHFMEFLDTKLQESQEHSQSARKRVNQFAILPEYLDKLERYFKEIDSYYAQIILPNISFDVDLPVDAEVGWQKDITRAAKHVLSQRKGKLGWSTEALIDKAAVSLERQFESDENSDSSTVEQSSNVEAKPFESKELIYSYNLFDVLPKGAQNIRVISTTLRGVVAAYELKGVKYIWFDSMSFQLESLTDGIVATSAHFSLSGLRNGEVVTIVDGKEYVGWEKGIFKINNDLLVLELTSLKDYDEKKTIIDGKEFPFSFPVHLEFGKTSIALVAEKDSFKTGYVLDRETLEITQTIPSKNEHGGVLRKPYGNTDIFYFSFFNYLNDTPYVIDSETQTRFYASSDTFLRGVDQRDRQVGRVVYVGNDAYIAFTSSIFSKSKEMYYFEEVKRQPHMSVQNKEKIFVEPHFMPLDNQFYSFIYEVKQVDSQEILERKYLSYSGEKHSLHSGKKTEIVGPEKDTKINEFFVNFSPYLVTVTQSQNRSKGVNLDVYDENGLQIPHLSDNYKHMGLEAVCVFASGDRAAIFSSFDPGLDRLHYYYPGQYITSTAIEHMSMIDVYNETPIVVVTPEKGNEDSPIVYFGAEKLELTSDGSQLIFGNPYLPELELHQMPDFVATFNPKTGIVKEINPQHHKMVEPSEKLSREDLFYMQLAQFCVEYKHFAFIASEGAEFSFDEENQGMDVSPDEAVTKMSEIQGKIRELLLEKFGPEKLVVMPEEEEYVKKHFKESPEMVTDTMPAGLDPLTKEFEDEVVRTLVPEVWIYEKEIQGQRAVRSIHDIDREHVFNDTVLKNKATEIRGGNALEQFKTGDPFGKVHNHTLNGVIDALLMQDKYGWVTFRGSELSGEVAGAERSTEYIQYVTTTFGTEREVRLLLQPDARINLTSVVCHTSDGQLHTVFPRVTSGYPVVETPPNTTEIRYKDEKLVPHLKTVQWSEYDSFAKEIREKDPQTFKGLSEALPLDPRLNAVVQQLKQKSPLEALMEAENMCRNSGLYDMDNVETSEEREGKNAADTLQFARVRATQLASQKPELREKNGIFYAGVCAESALLLVAMLRKLGFLAGVTTEYRPRADGTYSEYDAHASVFCLWPGKERKQLLFLDGTFRLSTNDVMPPQAHESLKERIEKGAVQVDETTADDFEKEMAFFKKRDGGLRADSKYGQYFSFGDEYAFQPLNQWERQKLDELQHLDSNTLSRLHDTLVGLLYSPPTQENETIKKANSSEERWNILLEQFGALTPKKTWKNIVLGVLVKPEANKRSVVEKILIELRGR